MTQTELGALINFSQPAVSLLERNGPASFDIRVLRLVARAFQVPLAILVVESDEEAQVDRRQFFRVGALGVGAAAAGAGHAVASGIQVGVSDVVEIRGSVNEVHELDLLVGGDRLCLLAAGQVHRAQWLLDNASYTEEVGKALASATAELMTAAGWVHFDANERQAAREFYADAVQTANESGDGIAAAHALMNASIIDLPTIGLAPFDGEAYRPRPQTAVNLSRAAQSAARGQGGPKVRALAELREAQAQGVIDSTSMEKAIGRAHRAYESGRGYDPEWVWLPEAEFNALMGIAYLGAGMNKQAGSYLQAAHDTAGDWPREKAAWQLYQAQNYIDAGDPARACSLLSKNFDAIQRVASARLQRKLDALAAKIRLYADISEVKEFLEKQAE
ncbi:helix-turn-helix transcriptional regulator [Nocardia transvalensis]|nr:helix-turn-helix transcriptional regulator [Nocardia transvalensis]